MHCLNEKNWDVDDIMVNWDEMFTTNVNIINSHLFLKNVIINSWTVVGDMEFVSRT